MGNLVDVDLRAVVSAGFSDDGEVPVAAMQSPQQCAEMLERQGMLALFGWALGDSLADWPDAFRERVKEARKGEFARDLFRIGELAEILSGLHEEGFRVLLLKGMPLGLRLYPDLGLRPRCDTDLLVERAALPALDRIMDGLGFVTSYPAAEGDYNAEVAYRPSSRERMFVYDVHWEISNKIASFSRAMGFEYLWSRSVELEVEGVKTRTLGDVDALLLACVHRAGHLGFGGERLIWLYDIHLLLERLEPSQKEEFAQRGVELGIQDECLDAVVKSAEWFSTTGCGFIVEFFHRAGANVGALANAVGRTDALKGRTLRELRRLQSAGERWGYLRRLLFPSREYMMHRYGVRRAGLLPFYYLYRIYFAGKVWLLG